MDKTRTFKQDWVKVGSFKMMPRRSEPRPEDVVWVSRRLPGTSAGPRALSGALAQPVIGYTTVDLKPKLRRWPVGAPWTSPCGSH